MLASPDLPRYRGAVIGLGGIARQCHLPAYALPAAAERLEIVAACDPADRGAAPGLPVVREPEALAAFGPLDFVDVCTPTCAHVELTVWALEHGYHVLCEKPVAISRAEASRIRDAAARAGRVVMGCHQYRYNPVWRRLARWLNEQAIGRWHLAELDVYRVHADPGASAGAAPWRTRSRESRGGVLLDHGTHLIYQLLDLAGEPDAVHAWTGRLRHREYEVEDSAHLLLEFPGRAARIFLTWAAHRRENRIRFHGERGTIEWSGGVLSLEHDGRVERFDHSAELDKAAYVGWYAGLFASFADAMDAGDAAPLGDVAAVAGVLEAAYQAAGLAAEPAAAGAA